MKTFLILALTLTVIHSSSAQESSVPLRMSKNLLVHSAGLPEEFLLFASDTATQIIFNPSRGNSYPSSFVYGNYLSDYSSPVLYAYVSQSQFVISPMEVEPYQSSLLKGKAYNFPDTYQENYSSAKNPSFSAVSLIKDEDVSWLFSFYHGLSNTETTNMGYNDYISLYLPGFQKQTYNSHLIRSIDASETVVKISRIWSSSEINYSLGLFGLSYNSKNYFFRNDGNERILYSDHYNSDTTRQRFYMINSSQIKNDISSTKKAIGLEFGLSSNNFDYIGSFSYQISEAPEDYKVNSVAWSRDSTISTNPFQVSYYHRLESVIQDAHLESSPYILSLENYYQHKASWITDNDNVFISFNGFYSPDSKTYSFAAQERRYSGYNGDFTSDSLTSSQSGGLETKSWGYNFSAGYVLKTSLADIDIVSGLRFHTMNSRFEDIDGVYSSLNITSFSRFTQTYTQTGFLLPIYLNFTPVKWFSVYGGFNYFYFYNSQSAEGNMNNKITYTSAQSHSLNDNSYNNDESWKSSKSIYIGTELRHESGLRVQFYFDDNITSVRNWNVSLGYHF